MANSTNGAEDGGRECVAVCGSRLRAEGYSAIQCGIVETETGSDSGERDRRECEAGKLEAPTFADVAESMENLAVRPVQKRDAGAQTVCKRGKIPRYVSS